MPSRKACPLAHSEGNSRGGGGGGGGWEWMWEAGSFPLSANGNETEPERAKFPEYPPNTTLSTEKKWILIYEDFPEN